MNRRNLPVFCVTGLLLCLIALPGFGETEPAPVDLKLVPDSLEVDTSAQNADSALDLTRKDTLDIVSLTLKNAFSGLKDTTIIVTVQGLNSDSLPRLKDLNVVFMSMGKIFSKSNTEGPFFYYALSLGIEDTTVIAILNLSYAKISFSASMQPLTGKFYTILEKADGKWKIMETKGTLAEKNTSSGG